jgi:segregation and condensation protein B
MRLTQIIEALLFASDAPLSAADLARVDERLDEDTITAVIDELRRDYDETDRSFQIYEIAGGFQVLTRPEYAVVLEQWETVPQTTRLSLPALEVLAIIAYRQPLGRAEVEEIRGVQSAAVLRTLQDRGLIDTVGRAEGLGRPMLYGTTLKFLEHFGFRSLEDLPRPDELPVVLRERPRVAPDEDAAGEAAAPPAEGADAEPAAADAADSPETMQAASDADPPADAEDPPETMQATSDADPAPGPAAESMDEPPAADTSMDPPDDGGAAESDVDAETAATREG